MVPALPVVPAATCPATAGALGGVAAGTLCSATSGVAGAAGSALGGLGSLGVGSVLDALGSWVTGGAVWLLARIGAALASSTAVDLSAPWFRAHYATMAALAGVVVVPLLLLGIVQAVYRQSTTLLLRSALVHLPLALLLTGVAVSFVQLGLAATDSLSAAVAHGAGLDSGHFLSGVADGLTAGSAGDPTGPPTFVVFLGGVAVVVGAVLVWLELLVRAAAVYVAVLFLPLALASLAWPAIAHWSRRLADTLVALVLSKFVVVAVLSLAAGALAGGSGQTPSGATAPGGGFASVLGGAALLLLAAAAPWALLRLLPFVEAGAVGHLEGLTDRARRQVTAPVKGLASVALESSVAGTLAAETGGPVGTVGLAAADRRGESPPGGPPGSSDPEPHGGGPGSGGGPVPSPGPVGSNVPEWAPHPGATAVWERWLADGPGSDDGGAAAVAGLRSPPEPDPAAGPGSGSAALRPLPRQTGALRADALGRDRLGVRLVAAPADRVPSDRPEP